MNPRLVKAREGFVIILRQTRKYRRGQRVHPSASSLIGNIVLKLGTNFFLPPRIVSFFACAVGSANSSKCLEQGKKNIQTNNQRDKGSAVMAWRGGCLHWCKSLRHGECQVWGPRVPEAIWKYRQWASGLTHASLVSEQWKKKPCCKQGPSRCCPFNYVWNWNHVKA